MNSNNRRTVINPAHQIFLGLVEMTFGLAHVSYSLPEWQAVKPTFFAPCVAKVKIVKMVLTLLNPICRS